MLTLADNFKKNAGGERVNMHFSQLIKIDKKIILFPDCSFYLKSHYHTNLRTHFTGEQNLMEPISSWKNSKDCELLLQ